MDGFEIRVPDKNFNEFYFFIFFSLHVGRVAEKISGKQCDEMLE